MNIRFLPQNIKFETDGSLTVLEAARLVGVDIPADCGGAGLCGMCRVRLVSGTLSQPTVEELALLGEELGDGWRLSCCAKPMGDCVIELPASEEKVSKGKVRFPADFAPAKGKEPFWRVAFDIGTTTVAGMLCRENGEVVAVSSRANPQGTYGADVISRSEYCINNEKGLETLCSIIRAAIDEIIGELCEMQGLRREDISMALAVGNSTMTHILMGVDPRSLAKLPFAPVFLEHEPVKAADMGIHIAPEGLFEILPNIAGHVGADITGALLASRLTSCDAPAMMIDIGTNGEMGFYKNGELLVCSTAAGPAFEGASIVCGTRAIPGAISGAQLVDGEFVISTIDDKTPVGICGSGLIDIAALLIEHKVIEPSGRIKSPEKAEAAGIAPALTQRIRAEEKNYSFVLYEDEKTKIALYQKDVREIQLAKGAIAAGMNILMKELDMTVDDLSAVMLAGAFGNHIRPESALRLGIIPNVPRERVIQVGNAAGSGAAMSVMSDEEKQKGIDIARAAKHIELGSNPDFQNQFVAAMRLG